MSVQTTRNRLVDFWRLVPGVKTVFDHIPRVIQDAELPAVIVFPGQATYRQEEDYAVIERRTYEMTLYLANAALGAEGQAEIALDPYFARVRDYFYARPGLELDTAGNPKTIVMSAELTGDSGITQLIYPVNGQTMYIGVVWTLVVEETAEISYQE